MFIKKQKDTTKTNINTLKKLLQGTGVVLPPRWSLLRIGLPLLLFFGSFLLLNQCDNDNGPTPLDYGLNTSKIDEKIIAFFNKNSQDITQSNDEKENILVLENSSYLPNLVVKLRSSGANLTVTLSLGAFIAELPKKKWSAIYISGSTKKTVGMQDIVPLLKNKLKEVTKKIGSCVDELYGQDGCLAMVYVSVVKPQYKLKTTNISFLRCNILIANALGIQSAEKTTIGSYEI